MKRIIGFASFLFLVLLSVLPADASFAATNANVSGISLSTDKQGVIKASGSANQFTLNLIGVPGNTEIKSIQVTSNSLNADHLSVDPSVSSVLHFVNQSGTAVATLDKNKLTAWFNAGHQKYQVLYKQMFPNEQATNNLATVQNIKDYSKLFGTTQTGYIVDKSGAQTPVTMTVLVNSGWNLVNGKWYDYNAKGGKLTGWVFYGGKWYFLDSKTGTMLTKTWVFSGGKWYYLNSNGTMKTSWIYYGNKWYYLTKSGAMAANAWVYDAGKWYYMDNSGVMKTGWVYVGKKWYFLYNDGHMAANTKIGSYRVGKDGAWIH